jgi:hypothetical protein
MALAPRIFTTGVRLGSMGTLKVVDFVLYNITPFVVGFAIGFTVAIFWDWISF